MKFLRNCFIFHVLQVPCWAKWKRFVVGVKLNFYCYGSVTQTFSFHYSHPPIIPKHLNVNYISMAGNREGRKNIIANNEKMFSFRSKGNKSAFLGLTVDCAIKHLTFSPLMYHVMFAEGYDPGDEQLARILSPISTFWDSILNAGLPFGSSAKQEENNIRRNCIRLRGNIFH